MNKPTELWISFQSGGKDKIYRSKARAFDMWKRKFERYDDHVNKESEKPQRYLAAIRP